MDSSPGKRLPRPVDGIDMRTLPIGPEEAFVLSRVDGSSSEHEIAAATGLDAERVAKSLARLVEVGAVRYGSDTPTRLDHVVQQAASVVTKVDIPAADTAAPHEPRIVTPAPGVDSIVDEPIDPHEFPELNEEVDIPLERRAVILRTYYRLEQLSHYGLLGVARNADKKDIKRAYYEVVNVFHPDRYFGRHLGSYKSKLEKLFTRVTEAHDTLTRQRARDEYDQYLRSRSKTLGLDRALDVSRRRAELTAAERQIEERARAAIQRAAEAENSSPSGPPPAEPKSPSSQPSSRRPTPTSHRPSDPDAKRKAFARRLGASIPPGHGSSPPSRRSGPGIAAVSNESPASVATSSFEHVTEALRQRYEQGRAHALREQIEHYRSVARAAEQDKDPVSALNALKIAATLAPDDESLKKDLEAVELAATRTLAETYVDQAQYEEREGLLDRAADHYERAALGKNSAHLYHRAAYCILEGGGDLRRAGENAKKAVLLAPEDAEFRLTLARVYAAVGMRKSALAELERANALNPAHAEIKTWLKRVKKDKV